MLLSPMKRKKYYTMMIAELRKTLDEEIEDIIEQ